MIQCIYCKQLIDSEATVCHHCRKNQTSGRNKITLPIVLLVLLFLGVSSIWYLDRQLEFKPVQDIDKAQTAVISLKRVMKDPSSAITRDVRVAPLAVCGWVNGKNSFGAYGGFERFVVIGDLATIEGSHQDDVQSFDEYWKVGACDLANPISPEDLES